MAPLHGPDLLTYPQNREKRRDGAFWRTLGHHDGGFVGVPDRVPGAWDALVPYDLAYRLQPRGNQERFALMPSPRRGEGDPPRSRSRGRVERRKDFRYGG